MLKLIFLNNFTKIYYIKVMKNIERKEINDKDIELFKFLIIKYNLLNTIVENSEKLLWKDFLLYFKKVFIYEVGEIYTRKISIILRQLLNIDQEFHLRKGIKLRFEEWLSLYYEISNTKM